MSPWHLHLIGSWWRPAHGQWANISQLMYGTVRHWTLAQSVEYICETRYRILQRSQFGANCRRRCKLNSIENQFMPIAVPNPLTPSNSIQWLVTFFLLVFLFKLALLVCLEYYCWIYPAIQPTTTDGECDGVNRCESKRHFMLLPVLVD